MDAQRSTFSSAGVKHRGRKTVPGIAREVNGRDSEKETAGGEILKRRKERTGAYGARRASNSARRCRN